MMSKRKGSFTYEPWKGCYFAAILAPSAITQSGKSWQVTDERKSALIFLAQMVMCTPSISARTFSAEALWRMASATSWICFSSSASTLRSPVLQRFHSIPLLALFTTLLFSAAKELYSKSIRWAQQRRPPLGRPSFSFNFLFYKENASRSFGVIMLITAATHEAFMTHMLLKLSNNVKKGVVRRRLLIPMSYRRTLQRGSC